MPSIWWARAWVAPPLRSLCRRSGARVRFFCCSGHRVDRRRRIRPGTGARDIDDCPVAWGLHLCGLVCADRLIPITVTRNKTARQGQHPIYSAWNTISKVDVYEVAPQRPSANEPGYRTIVIDAGTAATTLKISARMFVHLNQWQKIAITHQVSPTSVSPGQSF